MSELANGIRCVLRSDGSVIILVDVELPYAETAEIRRATWIDGQRLSVDTCVYTPSMPIEFNLPMEHFVSRSEITLAVADPAQVGAAVSWDSIPWLWRQRYRARADGGEPVLLPME